MIMHALLVGTKSCRHKKENGLFYHSACRINGDESKGSEEEKLILKRTWAFIQNREQQKQLI